MLNTPPKSRPLFDGSAAYALVPLDPIADAVDGLSDAELLQLEDDLDFFAFTGVPTELMLSVLSIGDLDLADALKPRRVSSQPAAIY